MKKKGILVVLSGFSGAGKGTLVRELLAKYDTYTLSTSMTTRQPRPGEQEGREYFFRSKEEFEKSIEEGGVLEYASYCGNYYGTPKAFVEEALEQGRDVLLEIEIQGGWQIKNMLPQALLVFVTPPNGEELRRRLEGRGTESREVVCGRLARAVEEARGMESYDAVLVNDDLAACVEDLHHLIQSAKASPLRQMGFLEELRRDLSQFAQACPVQ